MPTAAGIVLAGGCSSRMGAPKTALEWHGSTLLRHVVGLAAGVAAIDADAAHVSSTDASLLHPAFVRRVLRALDDGVDVVLPRARGYPPATRGVDR
jgi:molybdenum cofactor guanylyltransferase